MTTADEYEAALDAQARIDDGAELEPGDREKPVLLDRWCEAAELDRQARLMALGFNDERDDR